MRDICQAFRRLQLRHDGDDLSSPLEITANNTHTRQDSLLLENLNIWTYTCLQSIYQIYKILSTWPLDKEELDW